MIELKNIGKTYKNGKNHFQALKNINLVLDNKGLVIILGKSGSGKSTLLNILGGLDIHTEGEVIIDGKSTSDFKYKDYDNYRNNYVGFVFQEYNLINDMTINENVEIPLVLKNEKDKTTKVDDALEEVGLNSIGHKKCNELSGGQRQRVAIARALVKEPKIILADEPTGALDSVTSTEIFELFKKIAKEKLVIIVTHNEELAYEYGDRIVKISDGNIVCDITRVNHESVKKIANNVLEVDSNYVLTKKDLKSIIDNQKYIGVSTNLHDLTLAYDEIIDYKKENIDEFKNTDIKINNKEDYCVDKNCLNMKNASKLAKDNLKKNNKKYRFLTGVFTFFSIFLIVSFVISMLNIDSFIAKQTINKNSLDIVEIQKKVAKFKENDVNKVTNILENNKYSYVNNYELTPYFGKNIESMEFVSPNFNGIIETNDISNLNLELVEGGSSLENSYQIIISDYMAYNFNKYGVIISENNKLSLFYPSSNKDLINKFIKIEETEKIYEIKGIYKTNFRGLLAKYNKGEEVSSLIISNIDFLYSKLVAKVGFYKQYKLDYKDYTFYEEGQVFIANLNSGKETKKFYFSDTRLELNKDKIDKDIKYYSISGNESTLVDELNDNEIIISIDHLYEIFREENKSVSELLNTTEIYKFLSNNEIKLSLFQNNSYSDTSENDVNIVNDISVKVVGVLDKGNRLFVADNINNILNNYLEGYDSIYFYNSDGNKTLQNKLSELKEQNNEIIIGNNLVNAENTVELNEIIEGMSGVFSAVTIFFLILSFIVCLNYMNIIVRNRNKELILFRTLGSSKKEIYKIFAFEGFSISVKSIIGGIIGSYIIIYILNNILSSITIMNIANVNVLSFNLLYCLLAFICVFAIYLLSAYLSAKHILNKSIVEAFKEG